MESNIANLISRFACILSLLVVSPGLVVTPPPRTACAVTVPPERGERTWSQSCLEVCVIGALFRHRVNEMNEISVCGISLTSGQFINE